MRRAAAAVGTSIFFALAPGVVCGVIPYWLTGWQMQRPFERLEPLRIAGATMLAFAAAVLVRAFARFVAEGRGTPAPVAPTEHLVVGGLYRHVRNPMYLAVVAAIVGQGVVLWQPPLFFYAVAVAVAVALFVRHYEEPTLRRQFGNEYEAYARAVPRWIPRLRPWQKGEP